MCRFFSRVVVVSVVALSLNIVVVPAAEARIQVARQAVSAPDSNCVDHAMEWLNQILGKTRIQKRPKKKATANVGGCIDPMGNPKPCT